MQEMQVRSLGQEDSLEEGMTTHTSILSWRVPWTEEPDGLQSIGLQRVRHNWSHLACMHESPESLLIDGLIRVVRSIRFLSSKAWPVETGQVDSKPALTPLTTFRSLGELRFWLLVSTSLSGCWQVAQPVSWSGGAVFHAMPVSLCFWISLLGKNLTAGLAFKYPKISTKSLV